MLDTNSILLNFLSFLKYIFSVLFAKFLSARLLIVQCSQFVFVYIYIYIYPSHFNCVGVVSVVSSPDY